MIGFCGALDFERNTVSFSALKRMCGLLGLGCAYIKDEFGIICDADADGSLQQPITVSHNGSLYTAAILSDVSLRKDRKGLAEGILEGYFEVGEEFIYRLSFPYALALYDGRCGELWLSKGQKGDKGLFYTERGGTLYFSTSLRPLIRLYGGCVRVSRKALLSYILSDEHTVPTDLFCDIRTVRRGQSLFCSRLGSRIIPTPCGAYFGKEDTQLAPSLIRSDKGVDIKRVLTDALFAFEYPQFDATMPMILPMLYMARAGDGVCISDPLDSMYEEYACERRERLGALFNVDLKSMSAYADLPAMRELKAIDRALTPIFEGCISDANGAFASLVELLCTEKIAQEKNIPLRIRRKGMIIQTSMWLDTYNIVLV